ncbi:phenolic glucoside malonyltransferase 1-like [Humulus lupulus]|uniref:phenolic glucoside malonyltransferase 1-like n=1 Tax=Humulus lupulus TaxID=3486 RepID=UPI002B40F69A|nr:phenolic glucoside malonyltransferase 1-like [Humulus lupulus]
MAQAIPNTIKLLDISHVTPFPSDSPESVTEFTLPLTFLDTFSFKFLPVQCLFFYSIQSSDQSLMASSLSKLRHSLSLTLQYFLPLAGKLTWPPTSPRLTILYKPGDAVSFTLAESTVDFHHFTRKHIHGASESGPLIPNLLVNDVSSSIMALQVTLFPNTGLCIGVTFHHAVLDGKSSAMFMKSWAYISKTNPPLSQELTPFYDRTTIKDPNDLNTLLVRTRGTVRLGTSNFRTKAWRNKKAPEMGLYEMEKNKRITSTLRLSPFVLASAYILTTMVKATDGETNRRVYFVVTADYRRRLDPPLKDNYFGNCAGSHLGYAGEARELSKEDGSAIVAAKISNLINKFEKNGVLEGAEERLKSWGLLGPQSQMVAITWSPQFDIYSSDFSWGRPLKIEIASVNGKSISLMESKDGSGGIEIGLVLKKHAMDRFDHLFRTNIKTLSN